MGTRNYKKPAFDFLTGGIILEDGVWIVAKVILNNGIFTASHAVLTTGSVATKNLDAYGIYQGNPAMMVRERVI